MERSFQTAQDRLVKGLRIAGAKTLEEANRYLDTEFLPWWNSTLVVEAAHADDAHRSWAGRYDLAAILSHVATRQVKNDYTIQFASQRYQIQRTSVCVGLRGAAVRVERRMDGQIAVRFGERYLTVSPIVEAVPITRPIKAAAPERPRSQHKGRSKWMDSFRLDRAPSLEKAIEISNARS